MQKPARELCAEALDALLGRAGPLACGPKGNLISAGEDQEAEREEEVGLKRRCRSR